jgi:iron complex transport system ATP-binding protein
MARALAQEAPVLLLDEPTANLDPQAQAELCELLRGLVREGVPVLVVMHDLTLAAAYCDRVALLADGRLIASGTPAEVLTQERLRATYGGLVSVIPHPRTGLPVVAPEGWRAGARGATEVIDG